MGTCESNWAYENIASPATSLAWASDNRHIAASIGQSIQIFRLSDPGQIYDTINKHAAPIQAIAWSSKNVGASVDEKQVLQVWRTRVSSL